MNYRAIGLMSGSSLDGLDIVFATFEVKGNQWSFQIEAAECLPYPPEWKHRLASAITVNAQEYQILHSDYGHYLGQQVNDFIHAHGLHYRVALVASHGHTTFHIPPRMTGQIGCGAAIAAETGLPVVSDLRAMDVALGGQGAPIVPMGEKLLFPSYHWFLNLGGIANITASKGSDFVAFDVCPANRVMNMLAANEGLDYDINGGLAASGTVDKALLEKLNSQPYYNLPFPKSLANDFGTDIIYPMVMSASLPTKDALRTVAEHIAYQIAQSAQSLQSKHDRSTGSPGKMLITGGGAMNAFLVRRIQDYLQPQGLIAEPADPILANYKEALIMALLGVLRWREEATAISGVTGASRDSIGGAVWMGHT